MCLQDMENAYVTQLNAVRLFTAAMVGISLSAQAQPPGERQPAAEWRLDPGGHRCLVARVLQGSPAATLLVQVYPGSNEHLIALAASAWPSGVARAERLRLSLQPGKASVERLREVAVVTAPNGGQILRFAALPDEFFRAFAGASTLTVSTRDGSAPTYEIPDAAEAARVLADCERKKLIDWGADPAGLEPGARRAVPIGDPHRWVQPSRIPGAYQNNQFRLVGRLSLDPQGRPTKCEIVEAAFAEASKAAACRSLMERARYEPARDPAGRPVRAVVTLDVAMIRLPNI
jgi:hypothetical protein